ncbi:hypothetical protein BC332_27842 [Capsicum chinense]|nr:hypothetical protein BC332_27842 [Capsicum chinense]
MSHDVEVPRQRLLRSNVDKSSVEFPNNVHNSTESLTGTVSDTDLTRTYVAEGQNAYAVGKSVEVNLLDEKTLLSCIVRIIQLVSGGRINISSTSIAYVFHRYQFHQNPTSDEGVMAVLLNGIGIAQVYRLPSKRNYASYFGGDEKSGLPADDEARDLWLQFLSPSRGLPFGCKIADQHHQ